MAFTEKQEYKVEIIPPYNILQVRRADIIEKDGVEIARSYHRHSLQPGADVSNECTTVKAIAPDVWTAEVVAAYAASLPPEPEPEPVIEAEPEPQPNE